MTGEMIDGKYSVTALLGEGGMGRVYKARHKDLDIDVAVKVIIPDQKADQKLLQKRFDQEAKAMARLNHANIVDVKDYSAEKMYIVMEYLEGETLDEKIKRDGAMPVQEALVIFKQILEALDYAHNRNVVHRDIKPGNIFITHENHAKVMDFGLAAVRKTSGLTRTMIIAGTPTYEAPEQKKGLGFADHRSDVYSAGVALYETLVGTLPSADDADLEVRREIEEGRIPPLDKIKPDLQKDLVKVVMRAVQEDPAKRFQSAAEMLTAIRAIVIHGDENGESRKTTVLPWTKYAIVGSVAVVLIALLLLTDSLSSLVSTVRELISSKPSLSITSTPDGSEVFLAGQLIGLTPIEENVVDTSGMVALRVSKDGFVPWDTSLVLARGTSLSIFKRLDKPGEDPTVANSEEITAEEKPKASPRPLLATLSLSVIPSGRILVDGTVREGSPRLPAGQHTVRFEHPTLGVKETTVNLKAGETRSLECYFEGIVNIIAVDESETTRPCFIWVDGRNTFKETATQITLSAGNHTIGVTKSGYDVIGGNQTIQINPSLDKRNVIPLRFGVRKQ